MAEIEEDMTMEVNRGESGLILHNGSWSVSKVLVYESYGNFTH